MFFIHSLSNILSQMSPVHIFNTTFLPYIVSVFFFLRRYLPNEAFYFVVFYHNICTILWDSCYLHCHTSFFSIILTLFFDLLITKLPITLFHSVLLALPLFTSRYPPCNIFLSNTLSHTWSLNMRYESHTHTNNSYVLLKQLL